MRIASWITVLGLVAIPLAYVSVHHADPGFMSSTMGNWFATVVGIIAGVPVGVEVTRRIRLDEEAVAREREAEERRKTQKAHLASLRFEIIHNQYQLETFRHALPSIDSEIAVARWPWLVSIADSITQNAFDEVVKQRAFAFWQIMDIWLAYDELRQFRAESTQAAARAHFYAQLPSEAIPILRTEDFIREHSDRARELLKKAMSELEVLDS